MAQEIEVVLKIIDQMSAEVKKVRETMDKEFNQAKASASGLNKAINDVKGSVSSIIPYAVSAGGAIMALAAAFRFSIKEAAESQRIDVMLNNTLITAGHIIGVTRTELDNYTASIMAHSKETDEMIKSAENVLLRFTRIGKEIFPQALQAAADLSAQGFGDMAQTAQMLGRALNDPEMGLRALRQAGLSLSDSQIKNIKNMMDLGQEAKAQKIILKELNVTIEGSAETLKNTASGAWAVFTRTVGEAAEEMGHFVLASIGLEDPKKAEELQKQADAIEDIKKAISGNEGAKGTLFYIDPSMLEKQLMDAKRKLEELEGPIITARKKRAKEQAAEIEKERIAEIGKTQASIEEKNRLENWAFKKEQILKQHEEEAELNKLFAENNIALERQITQTLNDEYQARVDNARSKTQEIAEFSQALGVALAAGVGKGAESAKESLKAVLVTGISFLERKLYQAEAAAIFDAIMTSGISIAPSVAALIAGTAALEAAKAGINSFQTMPGQYKTVPGPMNQGQLAIVHGGEQIGRPSVTNNNQRSIHLHLEGGGSIDNAGAQILAKKLDDLARSGYLNNAFYFKSAMAG